MSNDNIKNLPPYRKFRLWFVLFSHAFVCVAWLIEVKPPANPWVHQIERICGRNWFEDLWDGKKAHSTTASTTSDNTWQHLTNMIGFLPIMPEHLQHSAALQEKAQASGTSQILSNDKRGSGITKGIVTVENYQEGKTSHCQGSVYRHWGMKIAYQLRWDQCVDNETFKPWMS